MANDYLFAIGGSAGSGKSMGLSHIKNQSRWVYLNCETNKPLPFPHMFQERVITDPFKLADVLGKAIASPKVEGIILDTFTSWLSMLESRCNAKFEGYDVWKEYKKEVLKIFQDRLALCNKPVFILCHTLVSKDLRGRPTITFPVQGSLEKLGLESFFTNILYADVMYTDELDEYKNDLLTPAIDDPDTCYVYQTRRCSIGLGANVRSTKDLWTKEQSFISNNCQVILDQMQKLLAANEAAKALLLAENNSNQVTNEEN